MTVTVVVIEDEPATLELIVGYLARSGHRVQGCTNLADAMRAIGNLRPDVIISDIGLPDGNGWDLMTRLGEHRPPYAIAMSGFGMSSDRQRSLNVGYCHHLLKPVEPNQLERLLDEAADEVRESERRRGIA